MALFDANDIPTYFSDLNLDATSLATLSLQVQTIIESPLGANRNLELTRHQEILRLNTAFQSVFLSYPPILLTNSPVIEARISNVTEWVVVDANQWQIDELTGKLALTNVAKGSLLYAYGGINNDYQTLFNEVKVAYDGGYDFSDTSNNMIRQIKKNAALIVRYIYGNDGDSAFTGRQIKSEEVMTDFKTSFFAGASATNDGLYGTGIGQIPRSLLQYFINLQSVVYGI